MSHIILKENQNIGHDLLMSPSVEYSDNAIIESKNQREENNRNYIESDKKQPNSNRSIRIFISSTFQDMIEERNALMTHCWPILRMFCADRHVEIVEVDLRWGITEEQSTRNETLNICINEIDDCRPYFIGLLGERYGWIPREESFSPELIKNQPWLDEHRDKSITELEMRHGVLNDPAIASNAFFFFRNVNYAKQKGPEFLSQNQSDSKKINDLKELIRRTAKTYPIQLFENYSDPNILVELILEKLKVAIDKQFPFKKIPNPIELETINQESFAETHRHVFVNRDKYFEIIEKHCLAESKPLFIQGDSGFGKTALLANWVKYWKTKNTNDLIFQHYIGSTSDSTDQSKLIYRLMVMIKQSISDPGELPITKDGLYKDISLWLSKARIYAAQHGIRIIVVLDAINQLYERDFTSFLGWFPLDQFTGNLKLIVSTLPEYIPKSLKKNSFDVLKIQPLSSDECKTMITTYLKHFGKELSEKHLGHISSISAATNPLYLKVLLDELRHTDNYDQLESRLLYYASANDVTTLFHKVISRYERDYDHDRPGLVQATLEYVWASRRGLTEAELLLLLGTDGLSQLPIAFWAPFRAALEDKLINHSGILNFSQNYFRKAVEDAYIGKENNGKDIRTRLVEFFLRLPRSERNCDEIPWLLLTLNAIKELRVFLLNIDNFIFIYKRDKDELLQFWTEIGNESNLGLSYVESFNNWKKETKQSNENISYSANQLALFLYTIAQYDKAEIIMQEALSLSELVHGPKHSTTAIRLNNLAVFLLIQNKLKDAEDSINRAIIIDEEFYGLDSPIVARDLTNLAGILQKSGRKKEAIMVQERALKISEISYGLDHADIAIKLNNIADLLIDSYRFIEAEAIARRALEINERNYGNEHYLVAISLNILANILLKSNKVHGVEALIQRAIKIDEKFYGKDHPRIASDLSSLASVFFIYNKYSKALQLYEKVLNLEEKLFGPDDPQLCSTLNNIASVKAKLKDYVGAKLIFERVLRIQENHYGIESLETVDCFLSISKLFQIQSYFTDAELIINSTIHFIERKFGPLVPEMANCLNHLSQIYHDTDRLKEAEPIIRKAIEIYTNIYGMEHPLIATEINNLAQLLKDSGRTVEAGQLMIKAYCIDEAIFGSDHPNVAIRKNNIAMLQMELGHFNDAESLLSRALEIDEKCYGQDHPIVADRLNNLGLLMQNMGRFNEAEPFMLRALHIDKTHYGLNHPSVARDLSNLGTLYKDLKRFQEAEPLMKKAIEIDVLIFGKSHSIIATRLNNLATLFYETNRLKEAEPLLKNVVEILYSYSISNGFQHQHFQDSINNYSALLKAMNWSEAEILAKLKLMIPKYFIHNQD